MRTARLLLITGNVICADSGVCRSAARITYFVHMRTRSVSPHLPRHSESGRKEQMEEEARTATPIEPNGNT